MRKIIWQKNDFNPKDYIASLDPEDDVQKTMVNTFFGIESVLDPYASVNQLEVISFHTNFNISELVKNQIKTTPGVEFCRILSRYRGVMSVGMCFDHDTVKAEIEARLIGPSDLDDIRQMLTDQYNDDGTGYVLYERDGKITFKTEDEEDYEVQRSILQESFEKHGGKIFKSPDQG